MKLSSFFNGALAVTAAFAVTAAASADDSLNLLGNMAVRGVVTSRCPAPVTETVTQTICISSPVALPSVPSYTTGGSAPPEASSPIPPPATSPTLTESTIATGIPPNSTAPGTHSPSSSGSGSESVTTASVSQTPSHSHEPSKPTSTSSALPTETTNAATIVGIGYSAGAFAVGGILLDAFMAAII